MYCIAYKVTRLAEKSQYVMCHYEKEQTLLLRALQLKSHLCIPFLGIARLSPNFHIHVFVSDLYILRIGPHIFLQQNRQTDPGKI